TFLHPGQNSLVLRISDDGTDRTMWISSDGRNFVRVMTESRTQHIVADQAGFYCAAADTRNCALTILSWQEGA
ncbi:MAG TPA: hypothetical protein VFL57_08490, partial [Bryobacteraceae bacterium]|nr:hypothetical protein [Bryobacteraceae bacterium]